MTMQLTDTIILNGETVIVIGDTREALTQALENGEHFAKRRGLSF